MGNIVLQFTPAADAVLFRIRRAGITNIETDFPLASLTDIGGGLYTYTDNSAPEGSLISYQIFQKDSVGNEDDGSNLPTINPNAAAIPGDTTPPSAIADLAVSDNATAAVPEVELIVDGTNPYTVIADITTNWVQQGLVGMAAGVTFDGETNIVSLPSASGHEMIKQAITVEADTDYYIACNVHTNNVAINVRIFVHPGDFEGTLAFISSGWLYAFIPTVQASWSKGFFKFNSGANTTVTIGVASGGVTTGYYKDISVIKY